MLAFVARRLIQMIPVLLCITIFIFALVRLVPGDPASAMLGDRATPERVAAINSSLKLDRPYHEQYLAFLGNLLQGDMGESIRRREPVRDMILQRIQPTLFLSAYTLILATLIAVPLSTLAALKKGRVADQIVRLFVVISLGLPTYWVAMMLLQFFAVKYRIFPVSGYGEGFRGHVVSLFLPAFTLALYLSSLLIRNLRNSVIETLESDYVRTARAKGLHNSRVFTWHVLRNSSLSTVTLIGLNFAFLIGGATITESIFSIPGIGQMVVQAIFNRDYPVIQGVTLAIGVIVLLVTLLTDIVYAMLDPRVTLA